MSDKQRMIEMLASAGVQRNAGSLREYEKAKAIIRSLEAAGSLPVDYGTAVRTAADYVKV